MAPLHLSATVGSLDKRLGRGSGSSDPCVCAPTVWADAQTWALTVVLWRAWASMGAAMLVARGAVWAWLWWSVTWCFVDRIRWGRLWWLRCRRLGKECPPNVLSGWGPGWDGEDTGSRVRQVLIQGILLRKALLDGDELAAWVTLVGDEREARVVCPGCRVEPVMKRIAAAEDALVLAVRAGAGVRKPNVRVDG